MIKSVDAIVIGQNRSKLDPLLDEHGSDYVSLYLRLLSKLSRTDTLQQILVLIDDMLSDRDDRLELSSRSTVSRNRRASASRGSPLSSSSMCPTTLFR